VIGVAAGTEEPVRSVDAVLVSTSGFTKPVPCTPAASVSMARRAGLLVADELVLRVEDAGRTS